MANVNLTAAKRAKNDEFYTQYADIQKEINAYIEYDPNVFKGKTVLLPCDDPEWSNFTKFFAQNFENFGLKKLISTSYAVESKLYKGGYQVTMFEESAPQYDIKKTRIKGKIFTLDHDTTGDGRIDVEDLEWNYLKGDGDFRSDEVKKLRDEADIIITNPPFSLFREFLAWIIEADKHFVIIGSKSIITYKEVFPLIKENRLWVGTTGFNKDMLFASPEPIDPTQLPSSATRTVDGVVYLRSAAVWFANIDHGRRHKPLKLMTMADNLRFNKKLQGKDSYDHYDNYDAIEVPYTECIPKDYEGMMAVPVSFLDKYNPDQFEILGVTQRNDDPYKIKQYTKADYSNANDLNARGVILVNGKPKAMYARILIKKKNYGNNS